MKSFFLVFILALANTLFAETRDIKKELYTLLITNVPKKFCQSSMLYRECYQVTEEECKDIMTLTIKACYKNNEEKISNDLSIKQGVLEISCQSDRILNSKGRKNERRVQF